MYQTVYYKYAAGCTMYIKTTNKHMLCSNIFILTYILFKIWFSKTQVWSGFCEIVNKTIQKLFRIFSIW